MLKLVYYAHNNFKNAIFSHQKYLFLNTSPGPGADCLERVETLLGLKLIKTIYHKSIYGNSSVKN